MNKSKCDIFQDLEPAEDLLNKQINKFIPQNKIIRGVR